MKPKIEKIIEVLLFLIDAADKDDFVLTQYAAVKSVFIADYQHLNDFGRPITFDNYCAMEYGPVPSETYDVLKPSNDYSRYTGGSWPLWEVVPVPNIARDAKRYTNPKRKFNHRKLSGSDVNAITSAYEFVKKHKFVEIKDYTHKLVAYEEAWNRRGKSLAVPMNYDLLLPDRDLGLVDELEFVSVNS